MKRILIILITCWQITSAYSGANSMITVNNPLDGPIPNITIQPSNSATQVPVNTLIVLTSSVGLVINSGGMAVTITNDNVADLITFTNVDDNVGVGFTATIDDDKKVITITPSSNLLYSKTYEVKLALVANANDISKTTDLESEFTTIMEAPGIPILSTSNSTLNSITLNWEVLDGGTVSTYEISVRTNSGDFCEGVGNPDNECVQYIPNIANNVFIQVIEGLNPHTAYFFKVRAINGGGIIESEEISTSTYYTNAPGKPNVNATQQSSQGFMVSWSAASDAEKYTVEVSTSVNFNSPLYSESDIPITQTSFHVLSAQLFDANTIYHYRVVAINLDNGDNPIRRTNSEKKATSTTPHVSMVSTAVNDTACEGEEVTFFAFEADTYAFYVDDVLKQPESPANVFTTAIASTDNVVSVDGIIGSVTDVASMGLTVVSGPELVISELPANIFVNADPIPISEVVPAEGTIFSVSGTGVVQGVEGFTFDPSVANEGNNEIIMVLESPDGCKTTDSRSIEVLSGATDLSSYYCNNLDADTVNVFQEQIPVNTVFKKLQMFVDGLPISNPAVFKKTDDLEYTLYPSAMDVLGYHHFNVEVIIDVIDVCEPEYPGYPADCPSIMNNFCHPEVNMCDGCLVGDEINGVSYPYTCQLILDNPCHPHFPDGPMCDEGDVCYIYYKGPNYNIDSEDSYPYTCDEVMSNPCHPEHPDYSDFNCDNFVLQNIASTIVPPAPANIDIEGFHCENSGSTVLNGSFEGGTFSPAGAYISEDGGVYTFMPSGVTIPNDGPGIVTIEYTYTDGNSCVNTVSKEITVYPQPESPEVDNIEICEGDTDIPDFLVTNFDAQEDGVEITWYAGDNPVGYGTSYNPALGSLLVGVTSYFVIVTVDGCDSEKLEVTYTVHALPTGLTIDDVDDSDFVDDKHFCIDDLSEIVLSATPAPEEGTSGKFILSIPGSQDVVIEAAVDDPDNPQKAVAVFVPGELKLGEYTMAYEYTNENGCVSTISDDEVSFEVHPLPVLSFTGLLSSYCKNEGAITLVPITDGVTPQFALNTVFTLVSTEESIVLDSGVFVFDPNDFDADTYQVSFTYEDINKCTNTSPLQEVVLIDFPEAAFDTQGKNGETIESVEEASTDSTVYVCIGEPMDFVLKSDADALNTYNWRFDDGTVSDLASPTKTYQSVGNNNVTLTVTNSENCVNIHKMKVTVKPLPVADFTFSTSCNGVGVFDASGSTVNSVVDKIIEYAWDFNGTLISTTEPLIEYDFGNDLGLKTIGLTVTTDIGCDQTLVRDAFIFTSYSPTTEAGYLETFEGGDGGWIVYGEQASWQLETAPETGREGALFMTDNGFNTYNNDEHSFVESPCFYLDDLDRGIVSLDVWSDTDEGSDGATLLYTVDNGASWKVLGNVAEGINWYNTQGVLGAPGEDLTIEGEENPLKLGWSVRQAEWKNAKFDLEPIKAELSSEDASGYVRFRVAFGSNSDNPFGEILGGFAFDNFSLYSRNKRVLLEHFTNLSSTEAVAEDANIRDFSDAREFGVIDIQYHTAFPGEDVLNKQNAEDPSARALHYGIAEVPRTVMDGVYGVYYNNTPFSNESWGEDAFNTRFLIEAPYNIDITLGDDVSETLKITAAITKNNTADSIVGDLLVQLALVEKQVAVSGVTHYNVVRKLLPNATGSRLFGEWLPVDSRSESITHTWNPTIEQVGAAFVIVASVHDANTKEVYQTMILDIPANMMPPARVVTDLTAGFTSKDVVLYPNPATDQVQIVLTEALMTDCTISISNVQGQEVYHATVERGVNHIVISTADFASGAYIVHLFNSNVHVLKKLHKQ